MSANYFRSQWFRAYSFASNWWAGAGAVVVLPPPTRANTYRVPYPKRALYASSDRVYSPESRRVSEVE